MFLIIRSRTGCFSAAACMTFMLGFTGPSNGYAATLPVPCVATSCGVNWSGVATAPVPVGNNLTINQTSNRAIYNWSSFNIGADGKVIFNQPGVNAIALNRIYDANPTQIFGSLQANGQLYLINQNGFLFGATARVNTGGLLASSLNITDDIFNNGLLSATQNKAPVLQSTGNLASVVVEPGARITTNADGQRILLAAKTIDNQGEITANGGQVILAAGDTLYVNASDDPALRGLLVEVNGGGTVTNTGSVTAERGNITAVGLAINQNGRMSATTSVSENGSIRLLARDNTSPNISDTGEVTWVARNGGELTLGANSITEVNADAADRTTAVNEQEQNPSTIELTGRTIQFTGGSKVVAAGGQLNVTAATDLSTKRDEGILDSGARIHVDSGALIDLSGNTETTSVTRNLVSVELRANELADSPMQRDGVLRGQTVVVDARVGTPLANVDGALNLIGHTVLERTSQGGTASFDTSGDIVVASNATIDVSGGAVNYTGGLMRTTQLIKADGSTVDIGKASADASYIGLINPLYKSVSDRWGVIKYIAAPGLGNYEAGYVQGADAGAIHFMGNAMALDGNFIGNAINGSHQRTVSSMAKGGQFIVGLNATSATALSFRAPEIQLLDHVIPTVADIHTALIANSPLFLSTDFLRNGFTRVQLASDKAIKIDSGASVDMQAGSSLALTAPRVEINADITTASGQISANALAPVTLTASLPTGLFIGDGTTLDVRGKWINDTLVPLDQQPTEALFTKGGSIALQQSVINGALQIGDDVALQASGGAWLKSSGLISGGSGGSISIKSNNVSTADLNQSMDIGNNLQLDGYGVQGASGGSFTLRAPRLQIIEDQQWLAPQQVRSNASNGGLLQIGSSLFTNYGFANFTLQADSHALSSDATKTTLDIASGTQINLSPSTLMVNSEANRQVSGTTLQSFSSAISLPAYQSSPASLSLLATTALGNRNAYGGISVSEGARIIGTRDTTVSMTTMGNLTMGGDIEIDSGNVNLSIVKSAVDNEQAFVNRQLTLADTARIDVSGDTILRPNDLGLRQGTVSDGGNVSISAAIGSVKIRQGAGIDISGTESALDLQKPGTGAYASQTVTSVGGSLSLQGAESIVMQGTLDANGGTNGQVRNTGGTLNVSLTRQLPTNGAASFSTDPRVVQITNGTNSTAATGVAAIDAALLADSGIDTLHLKADNQIAVGSGVAVQIKQGVTLDAPELAVMGSGTGQISAGYMTIGPQLSLSTRPVAASGTGNLVLNAEQIDVTGSMALQTAQTTLSSTGDIYLEGYGAIASAAGGAINTKGDLTLEARRIMPTTGSSFTINATGANSTVRIGQNGASGGVPMSAAGSLSINAHDIVQGGTLVAPFGSISLNASNDLQLLNGSVTSVSSDGSVLPYGRVDNGTTWVWGVNPDDPATITGIPERSITLTGATAELASGAVIDVSGGGDLLAYQFTPGTGGKTDVLAGSAKGMYAIVPALNGKAAPYDPMMWAGSNLTPGQSVYLADGSEVPAGVYQLMPARYALLPGAYLVTAVSGFQDLQPGTTASTPDGARVVAGYFGFGDSTNAAARYKGFAVRPGSYARQLAQYDDQLASTFFAAHANDSSVRTGRPQDAGALTVAVQQSLDALATVRGQAAGNGTNASVAITAPAIEVNSSTTGNIVAGVAELSSATLEDWHIGSLLLGGQRNAAGEVNVGSNTVTIHGGAELVADEVVLAATQAITVESGATLSSTSAQHPDVAVDESRFAASSALKLVGANADRSAVLSVSDLAYLVTEREVPAANNGAVINVATGANVATRGAVGADAAGNITLASGSVKADQASWALGARHLAFGNAGTAADGLAIDASLVGDLQSARSITLSSATDIDINQVVTLGANAAIDSLNIRAARINNLAGNASSSFTADRIGFSGVSNTAPAVAAGAGTIVFNGKEIELGAGQVGVSGFTGTTLNSSGLLVGSGAGGITTAGDLSVSSSAITTSSGAHTRIDASTGTLHLAATGGAIPAPASMATGGTLDITGRDIVDSAHILMPSGVVSISAGNSLSLQGSASIDTAGIKPVLSDKGSNGGAIHLNSAGSLLAADTTILNVSAGQQADAGEITLRASGIANLAGSMQGHAENNQSGGKLTVQAQGISDFAALTQQAQSGGFTGQQSYRVTSGDLAVAGDAAISAQQIELVADAGSININGTLTARSDEQQSHIVVNARDNVVIGTTASLDANAEDVTTQRGGAIELATTSGHIQMASTAHVQASGKNESGSLTLRAPSTASDFNLDSLPAYLSKVDAVILESVRSYSLTTATPGATQFNAIRTDLVNYVNAAKPAIQNRLGVSLGGQIQLRPYADLTRIGDLTLSSLDYGSAGGLWRFGGQPGVVSIRATGNINVAGIQSDGFQAVNTDLGPALDILATANSGKYSTSFNLVAGADLSSASNKATALNSGKDVVLNDNAVVRTGTGDIDVTASRDIVFGDQSSIYTGGLKGSPTVFNSDGASAYADRGGSVVLTAGNNVRGHVVQQAVNDWQTHWSYETPTGSTAVYWGVDYSSFGWNIGALGGGDVTVSASGNITDLSAAVADSAGAGLTEGSRVALGGGNLNVVSGKDIQSGYFYVGKGQGTLQAWGALNASGNRKSGNENLGTFLLSGDAGYRLASTGDVLLEGLLHNPALISSRPSELELEQSYVYFNRYGDTSELSAQSTGGNVFVKQNEYSRYSSFGNYEGNEEITKSLYPASLSFSAFGGDLHIDNSPITAPSSEGNLNLYASRDIISVGGIRMSDVVSKNRTATDASLFSDFVSDLQDSSEELIHAGDPQPAYVGAGRDIVNLLMNLPKSVEVKAGRDIVDLSLQGQQSGLATTTTVSAGRDLVMTSAANNKQISVGGTGTMEVLAGRDINLGFSRGVFSTGNLRNGNLPASSGANVIAIAGLSRPLGIDTSTTAASNDFVTTVIGSSELLQARLIDFMVRQSGNNSLDFAAASNAFRALPLQQQIPFAVDVLFSELVASGREANTNPALGFKRGYAALESLFPSSQSQSNPYSGNVSLPFSRIYSLNGGDIAVLAPGGKIDVGLANTPASLAKLNATRSASELGIVAQQAGNVHMLADQDVLVNTSRVFTLGGGNIAIWSSKGDIDAGKGAKSAISAPPPTLVVDAAGNVSINFASAVSGSGIRTISTGADITAGDVDLIAPAGFVNAGDAGIGSSGNLNIAAQRVVGLDNIQVGGASSGVPPETGGLGASLSGVTASAGSSTTSAANSVADSAATEKTPVAMADAALSWLEVFVVGLGEENCRQDDLDCLKRQTGN